MRKRSPRISEICFSGSAQQSTAWLSSKVSFDSQRITTSGLCRQMLCSSRIRSLIVSGVLVNDITLASSTRWPKFLVRHILAATRTKKNHRIHQFLLLYKLEQCLLVIPSNFQRSATVRGRDASSERPRRRERRRYSRKGEVRIAVIGQRGQAGRGGYSYEG